MRRAFLEPRIQIIIGGVLMIVLFLFYLLFIGSNLATTFDDAYMFMRYADNMLAGHGVAWNADGVQTYGVTSLLYLFVIVTARMIFSGADAGTILVITSAVLGMASLVSMAVGCAKISASGIFRKYPLLFPVFLTILFFTSPDFLFHATSGMDTTLALLCNVLLIFAALNWVKRNDITSFFVLILTGYISFLARPDNLIYAGMFPILYGFFYLREDRTKKILQFLVGFAVVLVIDTAVKYLIFGDPLPLPFYAKTNGYDEGYAGAFRWNPIEYLFSFFSLILPFLWMIVFSISKKNRLLSVAFFAPVLVTFAYFFSVTQIMGFGARYYFPSIPFFVIGSFLMFDGRMQNSDGIALIRQPVRVAAGIIMGVVLFYSPIQNSLAQAYETAIIPPVSKMSPTIESDIPELGWWQAIRAMSEICIQLPRGTKVAMSEYGLVGATATQIHIIDPLGLHDPFFAHQGFSSAEFFSREPDFIWLPHSDYTGIVDAIQNNPSLTEEYDYYPGAFDFGVAIRRDSEQYVHIHEIVSRVWKATYPNVDMEQYRIRQP